jgi:hypothetical protein
MTLSVAQRNFPMDEIKYNSNLRAIKRPAHLDAPDYLTKNTPVPAPKEIPPTTEPGREKLDPVRYGDWENKGIAIDF